LCGFEREEGTPAAEKDPRGNVQLGIEQGRLGGVGERKRNTTEESEKKAECDFEFFCTF